MTVPSQKRLSLQQSFVLVVDVQGRLARLMDDSEAMIRNQQILIEGCRLLDVPVIWAEQLPDKLGSTVPELVEKLDGLHPRTKSSFGCFGDPGLREAIEELDRTQVILCGIETHVCVWQSAVRMLEKGYQVHVVADAVGSRSPFNKSIGLKRMQQEGASLSVVEMVLFELMENATHPKFREVTKLLK